MVAVGGISSSPISLRDTLNTIVLLKLSGRDFISDCAKVGGKHAPEFVLHCMIFLTGLGTTVFCENVFIFIFIYDGFCGSAMNEK